MSPLGILFQILMPVTVAATPVPQPGEIKTFKDWTVGCDNGGVCKAVSLVPDQSDAFDHWQGPITLVRTPDQSGVLKVRVLVEAIDIDRYSMKVDGKLVDTGPVVQGDYPIEIVGEDARKVADAIARGNNLQVLGPSGENLTKISLAGSSAALRYIDARQNRARTKTALVAKGKKDFEPVQSSAPLVMVDQWQSSEKIPDTSEIVALTENSACKDERFGVVEDQAFPMGQRGGKYRALVLVSCGSGAYNFASAAYIGEWDEGKDWTFKIAEYDIAPGWGGEGRMPLLVNADWNGESQTLSSYAKGRGLGDCGNSERYVWDGNMFRLIEATAMPECRGGYEWITTWRANFQKIEQTAAVNP